MFGGSWKGCGRSENVELFELFEDIWYCKSLKFKSCAAPLPPYKKTGGQDTRVSGEVRDLTTSTYRDQKSKPGDDGRT